MALATSFPRASLARCARIQAFRLAKSGVAEFLANRPALFGVLTIDGLLDLEQGIDPADCFQRQRRDHCRFLALGLATRVLGQIGHHEERTPGVDPTGGFQDRTCVAARVVKLAIAAIGIGLEDPRCSWPDALEDVRRHDRVSNKTPSAERRAMAT